MIKPINAVLVCLFLFIPKVFAEDSNQDLKAEHFQVKWKPNSAIPAAAVYSNDPSKIKYNRSRSNTLSYQVEVRGRCPNLTAKLTAFRLRINNKTILDVPVSGNNRSLTGNNGKKWEAKDINVNLPGDSIPAIQACQTLAVEKLQTQSHDQVFNENFTTGAFGSGVDVEVYYHCEGGVGFIEPIYDTTELPLKALCEATGYESKLFVSDSTVNLQPITGQDGTCKLKIDGEFQTSYELYSLRTNQSTVDLKYRFKYNGSNGSVAYSQWWNKTANPINGGLFVFDYTDRLPTSINGGSIILEVESSGETYSSRPRSLNIDCEDAIPLQTPQTLDLNLSVLPDRADNVYVNGQNCPTHAFITGSVNAGYPINGKMIILGSTLTDLYPQPINLTAGSQATQQRRVKLNWPSVGTTLSLNGAAPSNTLKKQTLNYGLRITNSSNTVVKTLAKKPFVISCEHPSVNPSLIGPGAVSMTPDHTGGGGAPTSLSDNSAPRQSNGNNRSVREAGLRSDGELVQAIRLPQAPSRLNSQSQNNNNPPSLVPPVPVPYPSSSGGQQNQSRSIPLQEATIGNIRTEQLNNGVSNSHDRMANQETSHQNSLQSQRIMAPINSKPTLYKGNLGDACNFRLFPKNAIIMQLNTQKAVECTRNKVSESRNRAPQVLWKNGDPVYPSIGR
ncbi:MAG: hypothetical protein K6L75_03785 [Cellvibrionaceae bacterium]